MTEASHRFSNGGRVVEVHIDAQTFALRIGHDFPPKLMLSTLTVGQAAFEVRNSCLKIINGCSTCISLRHCIVPFR